jgi:hypothetical protein
MPKFTFDNSYADREELDLMMKPAEERMARNMREFKTRLASERASGRTSLGRTALQPEQRLAPLIEAAQRHGEFSVMPQQLSAILGLPVATSQADILSFLEQERQTLMSKGIRFSATNRGSIEFKVLELDTATERNSPSAAVRHQAAKSKISNTQGQDRAKEPTRLISGRYVGGSEDTATHSRKPAP